MRKGTRTNVRNFCIFILPTLVLYCLIMIYPLIDTFLLGFFEWNGIGEKKFVWFKNFAKMATDRTFLIALKNNLIWIIISILNPMLIGLIVAVLLSNVGFGRKIYSAIFFIPVVLSLIIVSLVWGLMYNPIVGPINKIISFLGGQPVGWLGNSSTVNIAIIIAGNWTYFGFCTVIFLAGLQNIDESIVEASVIDGAGPFRRFFSITIPCLRSQVNLLVINSIIGSFKVFDIVYNMTSGGPNHASEVVATYMYWQTFKNGQVGYGAALSTVLAAIVGLLSIFYLRSMEEPEKQC